MTLVANAATHAKARAFKEELFRKLVGFSPYARKRVAAKELFPKRGNLVGVGYGVKITAHGHGADEAVRVYVRKKRPKKSLRPKQRVPPTINGLPTDVIEVGTIVAQGHTWPVSGGASIGHFDVTGGSIGCRVVKPGDAGEYILSNNHVLANVNAGSVGDDILQPSPDDGGDDSPPPGGDSVGQLAEFAKLDFGAANLIDAAIARVTTPGAVAAGLAGIGDVGAPVDGQLHQSVRKSGRTTGVTIGVIGDLSAHISVDYGGQLAHFDHQLAIATVGSFFSDEGDSGALVVDAVTCAAVGLLMGGASGVSYANPITEVLAHFGVTIA